MHVMVEHVQDARDAGVLVRRMRDLDTVFMGCNIQNHYAGVCVENSEQGNFTTWNANMFSRGKWCEPLHTASKKQAPFGSLTAEQIGATRWMVLEASRTEMDQNLQDASGGAG